MLSAVACQEKGICDVIGWSGRANRLSIDGGSVGDF